MSTVKTSEPTPGCCWKENIIWNWQLDGRGYYYYYFFYSSCHRGTPRQITILYIIFYIKIFIYFNRSVSLFQERPVSQTHVKLKRQTPSQHMIQRHIIDVHKFKNKHVHELLQIHINNIFNCATEIRKCSCNGVLKSSLSESTVTKRNIWCQLMSWS